ncbi:condensation domain-containing protein [Hirsutella rhossiliensis]|uniref:Condensation domain-containing protein n=1 Tax=Hirsutella rhossiliensis TaxID=111463 RepID=A0A9P8N5H4_9HYPO|nr:condensation domain-containing protein [Hirsutella rhossiliensis]KAH0968858.1 condensation domain-containing protein [Hirsutella rhossiliensis]
MEACGETSSKETPSLAKVAQLLHVAPEEINDIYKCTPLQEALVSLTTKGSEAYVKRVVLSLNVRSDLARLRSAVDDVVKATPLLRTRIVHLDELGFMQVVLAKKVEWSEATSVDDCLKETKLNAWGIGDPLVRYTLVKDDQSNARYFVWTIHHALYDGWSFPLMVNQVCQRYDGFDVEPAPEYKHFVQHIAQKNQNEAKEYWKSVLSGTQSTTFPALPDISYAPAADTTVEYCCPPVPRVKGITRTALLRGAWALIMNRFHDSEDAVFGTIVSGRRETFVGIQSLMGPTVATIPVRVRVDGGERVDN